MYAECIEWRMERGAWRAEGPCLVAEGDEEKTRDGSGWNGASDC